MSATVNSAQSPPLVARVPAPLEVIEVRYLDPASLRFSRQGLDLCVATHTGRTYAPVLLVRLFPLSDPDRYVSLRSGGLEIAILVDPSQLDPLSKRLVAEELRRRYLLVAIRRVNRIEMRFATLEWAVETDRGRCQFMTRVLRENTGRPSPGRYILTDVDGNRYDLDLQALDRRSRALALSHLW
jgi:Domain of unknown function (DUF1854)